MMQKQEQEQRNRGRGRAMLAATVGASTALLAAALVKALGSCARRICRQSVPCMPHPHGCTLVPVALPPRMQQAQVHDAHASSGVADGQPATGVLQNAAAPELLQAVLLPHADASASETAVSQLLPFMLPTMVAAPSAAVGAGSGTMGSSRSKPEREPRNQGRRRCDRLQHLEQLERLPVLGMDAEWEPETRDSPHNPVSVLQVCGAHSCVLLLRPTLARLHNAGSPEAAVGPVAPDGAVHSQPTTHSDPLAVAAAVPEAVREVLQDPAVIKAGVGIKGDCTRLAQEFGIHVRGAVDLRAVARAVAPDALIEHTKGVGSGLAGLAAALLGRRMDKAQQCSHWGVEVLSQAQVAYAAQDAWLSRQLLLALFERHQRDTGGGGAADGNAHTEEAFRAFVAPFVDAHSSSLAQQQGHKQRQRSQQVAAGSHPSQAARQQGEGEVGVGNGAWSAQIRKPARHALRKKQLYENCRLMAPDGKVLCTCSTKKVLWYVERELGELLEVEPLTVRLRFEPRGRGHADDAYYTSDKENRCVVCGVTTSMVNYGPQYPEGDPEQQSGSPEASSSAPVATPSAACTAAAAGDHTAGSSPEHSQTTASAATAGGQSSEGGSDGALAGEGASSTSAGAGGGAASSRRLPTPPPIPPPTDTPYLRHHIVPHCYRKCFPLGFKSHLSHDIVLMCLACHQVCSVHDQARMAELGRQYNAPLEHDNQKFKHDQDIAVVRSAARALTNPKVRVPDVRRAELQQLVANHFQLPPGTVPTQEQLAEAADLDPRKPISEWASHAETVVAALGGSGQAIQAFVQGWRQHFLDTMQPKFLPPYWSVNSRVANSTAHVMPWPQPHLSSSSSLSTSAAEEEDVVGPPVQSSVDA